MITTAPALTASWFPLRYHEVQYQLWTSTARTIVAAAGRGSGKTEMARRRVVECLPLEKPWPDPRYFYALPTYGQAKRVAWDQLVSLIPRHWLKKEPSSSKMIIETVFGSRLYVIGLDKPARAEGVQWDGGVIDESCDQKPGVFDRSLRPALSHRNGWCWRIGVPKRFGAGAREFKHAFDLGQKGEGGIESFTWPSWDILSRDEIAILRQQLDEKDFNEQIGGRFVDIGGRAYHAFSEANIRKTTYDPRKMLLVFSDFNVDPMAWCLAQFIETPHGKGLEVIDEIWLRNTNTEATLDVLWAKYGEKQKADWLFVGDATSKARKSSASSSDYKQIVNDKRFKARVRYPKENPAVKDRLAAVNRLLCNAGNQRRLFVDTQCIHLIDDLQNRALDPDGSPTAAEPGQAHDSGHMTDALGYGVYKFFPITYEMRYGKELIVIR